MPIGAVVIGADGTELARAVNAREADGDPTAHAEILALRARGPTRSGRGGGSLVTFLAVATLEPCLMCAGALVLARLQRVVFGAWDPKAGAAGSVWDVMRDRAVTHRGSRWSRSGAGSRSAQLAHRFFRRPPAGVSTRG